MKNHNQATGKTPLLLRATTLSSREFDAALQPTAPESVDQSAVHLQSKQMVDNSLKSTGLLESSSLSFGLKLSKKLTDDTLTSTEFLQFVGNPLCLPSSKPIKYCMYYETEFPNWVADSAG